MLRYLAIVAKSFSNLNVFDKSKTGMAPYDKLLRSESLAKSMKVTVETKNMSPHDYLFESGLHLSLPALNNAAVDKYRQDMTKGQRFPLPVLHYGHKLMSQDGRHRAKAAEQLGMSLIPVLVVTALEGLFLEDIPKTGSFWKRDAMNTNPNGSLKFVDYVDHNHNRLHFDLRRKSVDYHGDSLKEGAPGFEVFDLKENSPEEVIKILDQVQSSLS